MSGYTERMKKCIRDHGLQLCCRTCSSMRYTPGRLWASEPYCNNSKKKRDVMDDEWAEVCEYWRPARWAVKAALEGGFEATKGGDHA